MASATYTFQAAMPRFSPTPTMYPTPQSVALSATTIGAAIYYTVDGTTPTTSSGQYTDPIPVTQNTTIKAIAVLSGLADSAVASATYTVQAEAPTFSPAGGKYTSSQKVTLLHTTAGTIMYYTTDGSTPTTSSTLYGDPISVAEATTIKAISVADGFANSPVAAASYTFQAASPTFSPSGGTYSGPQVVSLSTTTPDAVIYYTTDGSTPKTSSSPYAEPIPVTQNTIIRAIAAVPGWSNSSTASATYSLRAAAPTFSPSSGTYSGPQAVSLSTATPDTVIYYTTDGSTPKTSSEVYNGPLTVTATTTIKTIAAGPSWTNSAVATSTYKIN